LDLRGLLTSKGRGGQRQRGKERGRERREEGQGKLAGDAFKY